MQEFHPEASQTPLATREPLAAPARLQGAELQTFLRRKLHRLKTRQRNYGMGVLAVMTSGIITGLLCSAFGYSIAPYFCFFGFPPTLYTLLVAYYRRTRKAVQAEVKDMARQAGSHAVRTLFEMLYTTDEAEIKDTIRHALTRLLPQMTAADANVLTPYARRTMHGWLNASDVRLGEKWHLNALRIASLQALENVGDSRDIPVVERLAKMSSYSNEKEGIEQVAMRCLPILKANCEEVEAARTLLRASQPEHTDPDTLLRPASGAGQTDVAELLRGSDLPDAADSDGKTY